MYIKPLFNQSVASYISTIVHKEVGEHISSAQCVPVSLNIFRSLAF